MEIKHSFPRKAIDLNSLFQKQQSSNLSIVSATSEFRWHTKEGLREEGRIKLKKARLPGLYQHLPLITFGNLQNPTPTLQNLIFCTLQVEVLWVCNSFKGHIECTEECLFQPLFLLKHKHCGKPWKNELHLLSIMSKLKKLINISQWKLGVDSKLFTTWMKGLWIEAQI